MFTVVRSGVALDDSNERGKRILSNNEAKTVLKGFDLNGNANLLSVAPIKINFTTGATEAAIAIKSLTDADVTLKDLYSPDGTTHTAVIAISRQLPKKKFGYQNDSGE
jgi:cysteine sulfinate desulfinase/cysteine desulfurase-like protein